MNNPFDPSQKSYPSGKPVHPLERSVPAPQPPAGRLAEPARRVEFPQSKPILTYALLGINLAVFLADTALNGQLTQLGAKDNAAIMAGEIWRFITPMFLHGGWLHIGVNSYSLYIIGPQVERYFGHRRFAAIYLLSGIAGVIASFTFSQFPSIGASGAIFGLIGALLPLLYRNRGVLADTRRRMISIVEVIVINLLIGLMPLIDDWAHVGGLIGGLALAWFATPLYKVFMDVDGSIRVKDQSSGSAAWLAMLLLGTIIGGGVYMEILFRKGLFTP
jgi:membrane associated rhomboid family serine protease